MLSNFSWLAYGMFVLVSLLIYYAVIFLLYYRREMLELADRVAGRKGLNANGWGTLEEQDDGEEWGERKDSSGILGKAKAEQGMSNISLEDLHLANEELLQGELADCMEEISFNIKLAKEHGWDKKQLLGSFIEIPVMYPAVFRHRLAAAVMDHMVAECKEQLDMELSIKEVETLFQVKGYAKLIAGGVAVLAFFAQLAYAQDGNQGISEATNKVKGYFDTGTDLMYAIGAIMGLVGAVKVYSKWNAGEPDTAKVATAWFGSCIFLVVVATVLKSFFGI